jgi:hypothetical protein
MEMEQNQFKDAEGRVWTFRVTGRTLKAWQAMDFTPNQISDPKVIEDLFEDSCRVLDLMAIVLLEDLEKAGMTPDDLFGSFDGDVLQDAVWAFVSSCVLFLPSHKKKPLLVWVRKMKAAQQRLTLLAEEKAEKVDMEQAIDKLIENL